MSKAKPSVEIYTDGACSGNPGPGGWAAILRCRGVEKTLSGFAADTTNNRMELMAVIQALETLTTPCRVTIHSDSAYVVSAFQLGWLASWQRNGWKNAAGRDVSNPDLWRRLLTALAQHEASFVKVKGHADDDLNNRCDKMAVNEIKTHAHL